MLKIHFLPLYLFPLSLIVLWRRQSLAGHFMGAFGVISFLTPALVNFGPIYESEYYRWEFAAALGFAGALGLALAALAEPDGPSPAFQWNPPKLLVSRQGGKVLAVISLTLLNSWACLTFVGARLEQALSGPLSGWLYFPSTQTWLAKHQVLDFDPLDYRAAQWLSAQVQPGDRLLTNFRQENNFSILYESTLTGLTGARCVGHALPLEDEKIGTTPFRQAPAAVAFWSTFLPDPLSQLKANWILYRDDLGKELPPLPGAKLVHRVQEGERIRLIYQIDRKALPNLDVASSSPASGPLMKAELGDRTLPPLRGGSPVDLNLTSAQNASGILELSTVRRSDGLASSPSENLRWRLRLSAGTAQSVPLVPPYDEGIYQLRATWYPDPGTPHLEVSTPELEVAFARLVNQVRIAEISYPTVDSGQSDIWPTRVLVSPQTRLELPSPWPASDQVLACWAFYSEERGEFDLLPGVNLQQLRLSEQPWKLPFITPEREGRYRLALYLSAGQGHLTRVPAGHITISDRPETSP